MEYQVHPYRDEADDVAIFLHGVRGLSYNDKDHVYLQEECETVTISMSN